MYNKNSNLSLPFVENIKIPIIISASRRTDMVKWYPLNIISKINNIKSSLKNNEILYGIVFWTRFPQNFFLIPRLKEFVTNEFKNCIINLTITGLGGSSLEPFAPETDYILKIMPQVIDIFDGIAEKIFWRFDPVIKIGNPVVRFENIAKKLSFLGIKKCIISFPATLSLKGNLCQIYNENKIPAWTTDEKKNILKKLADIAQQYGITIESCCQPKLSDWEPGIKSAQCINREILEKYSNLDLKLNLQKDKTQRKNCLCIKSIDIGDYENEPCGSGCVYCYSKAGGLEGRKKYITSFC